MTPHIGLFDPLSLIQKIEGILLRSPDNWHENGEKCPEYFCKLEKKILLKRLSLNL
jgi:hypothetical protein